MGREREARYRARMSAVEDHHGALSLDGRDETHQPGRCRDVALRGFAGERALRHLDHAVRGALVSLVPRKATEERGARGGRREYAPGVSDDHHARERKARWESRRAPRCLSQRCSEIRNERRDRSYLASRERSAAKEMQVTPAPSPLHERRAQLIDPAAGEEQRAHPLAPFRTRADGSDRHRSLREASEQVDVLAAVLDGEEAGCLRRRETVADRARHRERRGVGGVDAVAIKGKHAVKRWAKRAPERVCSEVPTGQPTHPPSSEGYRRCVHRSILGRMSRNDLEQFVARWTAAVTQGCGFEELLAEQVDPAPFVARAAAMSARGGVFTIVVDDLVCDGDRVAWRWTLRAGDAVVRGVNFQHIVSGRLVSHWTINDG